MKNEILYLTMAEVNTSSGVYKKIRAQADAFERQGFETRILFVSDTDNIHYLKNGELRESSFAQIESEVAQYLKECSFCYARFELLRHKYFKKVLNLCIAANTKIVTEIPTFPPYQESFARAKAKLKSGQVIGGLKTMVGAGIVAGDMNALANMASMVCIVADDFKFKKTKTIRIENGIDLQKNPLAPYSEKNVINIIAVSNFAVWNGYDRAVEGLGQYYATAPKRKIHLTLVGPLDNAPELQKRVKELGLDNEVTFTGALSGAALDEQYANADIALGALGKYHFPKVQDVLKHIKPNMVMFIPVIAVSIYKYMDKLMLGGFSKTETGYYENVEKIMTVALGFITAFGNVMLPRMSNMVARKDVAGVRQTIATSMRFVLGLSCALTFGMVAVAPEFVGLYFGKGFEPCITVMIALAPTMIFQSWANVIRTQYLIPFKHDSGPRLWGCDSFCFQLRGRRLQRR